MVALVKDTPILVKVTMEKFADISVRNYSFMFEFEKEFNHKPTIDWMNQNWINCYYYIILYICIIFGTKHYMQDKPRYSLRTLLVLWNFGLTSFSIIGLLRTVPEFIHITSNHSFYYSVCVPSFITLDRVSGFWTWMCVLSKLIELGDTMFIVLRKQPLIFLHWYHHIMTLLVVWYTYKEVTPTGRWSMTMNLFAHSLMYFYYMLRAMGYTPPRKYPIIITTVQILQMVIGCGINIYIYNQMNNNVPCDISYESIRNSFLVYLSYFVLFSNFFYQSYILGKWKTKKENTSKFLPSSKTKVN